MKRIVVSGLVFCFALVGAAGGATGVEWQTAHPLLLTRAGVVSLAGQTGVVGAVISRIGRAVADKTKESERSVSPVRTSRPSPRPSSTPAPRPSPARKVTVPRSVSPVSRPRPATTVRPTTRTVPRTTRTVSPAPSRTSTVIRRTQSLPSTTSSTRTGTTVRIPSASTTRTSAATTSRTRPTLAPRTSSFSRVPTTTRSTPTAPVRAIGRSVSESVRTRTQPSPGSSSTTRRTPFVGTRTTTSRSTTPSSTSATSTQSASRGSSRLPGVVGRGTTITRTRSGTGSGTIRGSAGTPYVSSRYSRGHAGGYVTSRYSRGHAGSYVTSRYSRGHTGSYVTSRYSSGHATAYSPIRYSSGHSVGSTPSRWYYRSNRVRRYTRHYRYYGRSSDYYFANGRWLPFPPGYIHGVGSGYIFRYGMWMPSETVYYPVFMPVGADYYYDGGWHTEAPVYVSEAVVVSPEPEPVVEEAPPEYISVATKAEREFEVITRTYNLDWWQAKRVEDLISKQIIESILAGGEAGEESRIVFDKKKQELTITSTPDDIMRIRTIVDDDRTYKIFTSEDLGGMAADAVALVDLRFVENDPSGALRIAADNYSAADEILRSSEDSPFGREWWFNNQMGTMTVKDSVQNLDGLYEFMETRPFLR